MTSQAAHGFDSGGTAPPGGVATSPPPPDVDEPVVEPAAPGALAWALSDRHRGNWALGPIVTDFVGLAVAWVWASAAEFVAEAVDGKSHPSMSAVLGPLLLCLPVLVVALGMSRSRWRLRTTFGEQVHAVVLPLSTGGMVCVAGARLARLAGVPSPPSVDALLLLCLFAVVTVAVARVIDHLPPRRHHGRRARHVLIVGSGVVADRLAAQLPSTGDVEVVGYVDDDPKNPHRCLGTLSELGDVCLSAQVDHVVVAFSKSQPEAIVKALRPLQGHVPITVVPRLFEVLPTNANLHDIGSGLPGISVAPVMLGWWPRTFKRTVDLLGAGAILLICTPVLLAVTLAIRLTSGGPVLIRQTRVGRNGQEFSMLKFRSMVMEPPPIGPDRQGAELANGPFPKLKNDPRVTSVGRLIRRSSIDELPQLWNVARGQMSLVGPRPFVPDDSAWIDGWAERRYAVRPGITGLWQVSGRNDLTFDDMCRLDHLYVSCWSVGLDLHILLRTVRVVAQGRGAY